MDKVDTAIERIRTASEMSFKIYGKPLLLTYSGGKDSSVCLKLCQMSGVPFEVLHNLTTADAPDTVYFVRGQFKELELAGTHCEIELPRYKGKVTSMWEQIVLRLMPPTRLARYCCSILKERGGGGRFAVTGVRWAESVARQSRGMMEIVTSKKKNKVMLNSDDDDGRMMFETCMLRSKRVVNPIIDWSDRDVWDFILSEKLPLNPLYCEGFSRVGCIGCPMAGKHRAFEFARFPRYRTMYLRAFGRMLEERRRRGLMTKKVPWETPEDVFHWWMEDGVIPGQVELWEEDDDDG